MLSNAQIQKGAGIARVAGVKGKDSDRFLETQSRRRFRAPLANASSGDATRSHLLHEIFEAQANARPLALAVAFGAGRAWSRALASASKFAWRTWKRVASPDDALARGAR